MLIIFRNNKIISIEKNFLELLNIDFSHLSEIVSSLELTLSSLNNENFTIFSKTFKVKEIPNISFENIKIFDLQPIDENLYEPKIFIDDIELNSIKLNTNDELFNNQITQKENINDIQNLTQNTLLTNDSEIIISFNNENEEIYNILSSPEDKINKMIKEELLQASKNLNLEINTTEKFFISLLEQIKENRKNFKKAIQEQDYNQIHEIAHYLKGAALNLRLSNLANILKTIDEYAKEKETFEKIEYLIEQFYIFINKINIENENKNYQISDSIKEIIIQTIKNYLETQNENEFKKDLKYISKLLNTKINSLDELKQIIENIK